MYDDGQLLLKSEFAGTQIVRLSSSRPWHCVFGLVVSDILKEHNAHATWRLSHLCAVVTVAFPWTTHCEEGPINVA